MKRLKEVESRPHNSTYPKVAVQWLNQALYFYQIFCLVDSEVLRNRHLRVAVKRCKQARQTNNTTTARLKIMTFFVS
jgi:hypothetical protein